MGSVNRFRPLDSRDAIVRRDFHVEGLFMIPATTASTQATGAGASDYNLDITPGYCVIEGKGVTSEALADVDIDSSGSAVLASVGDTRSYFLAAWLGADGDARLGLFKGANNVGGYAADYDPLEEGESVVEAALGTSRPYWLLAVAELERTGDIDDLTFTYFNILRHRHEWQKDADYDNRPALQII